ncbi:Uncharacterised protein [Staphylococcus aureus]|nr:Uncharacterised protein [Staphylococcus aureus]CAA4654211.1 Uncharacterised protein [Staphylococcus aureus]CAC7092255.1 Uncharacterised protein [Staphylococcus aureus]
MPPLISVKPGKLLTTFTVGTERLVLGLIPLSSNDSTSLGAFCPALLALGSVVGVYGAVIATGAPPFPTAAAAGSAGVALGSAGAARLLLFFGLLDAGSAIATSSGLFEE